MQFIELDVQILPCKIWGLPGVCQHLHFTRENVSIIMAVAQVMCDWLGIFLRINVCKEVWVGEGQRASGYFQLCPFSYLMVFIRVKGQRGCIYVLFLMLSGTSGILLVGLFCLFKNAKRFTTGHSDPCGANLLSSKYQGTWPRIFFSPLEPFYGDDRN